MAKAQVITFPFVLLLWDYWPLQRMFAERTESSLSLRTIPGKSFSWLLMEKVPLFAMCAASAVITVRAARTGGTLGGIYFHPFLMRLQNAILSYARYLGKLFWPSNLALYYPYPGKDALVWWQISAALALLIAITALVIANRHRRYLLVGWLWFLGTLVPVIGLTQVGIQAMADRYAYVSFIGLFIMVCWGIADWATGRHVSRATLAAASAVVLVALFIVAQRQVSYWDDNVTLWSHAVQVTKNNNVAEDHLGGALLVDGQTEAAMPHFHRAVMINADDPEANLNIGGYEQQQRDFPEAIAHYKKVISSTQESAVVDAVVRAKAFNNMGYAYRDLGDLAHARESFEAAVASNPQYVKAWIGLGLVDQKSGNMPGAIHAYTQAMNLQPSDLGYLLLARALEQSGDNNAALTAIQQARSISRNLDSAQRGADQLLAQ
jgi:tetratricopeptide (TPR) repeat protein